MIKRGLYVLKKKPRETQDLKAVCMEDSELRNFY